MARPSFRFAIGDSLGRHSATWKLFCLNNDVYVSSLTSGKIEKFSFHASRICRRAFLDGHELPKHMEDRVLQRWVRSPTLPAGSGHGVVLLSLVFPEVHLSPHLQKTEKQTTWVVPPSTGQALTVQLFLTQEKSDTLKVLLSGINHNLIWADNLPNGETIAVRTWAHPFNGNDLVVPASHGSERDLVLPRSYQSDPPRTVAFTFFVQSDEFIAFQLSGYWMPAGCGQASFPHADTITRAKVIQSSANMSGGLAI